MFTGIVEEMGVLSRVEEREAGRRIRVEAPDLADHLSPGDSVAVDGACLTAVEVGDRGFLSDVIATTISRTIAKSYTEGSKVNLERALRLGDGLEGHLVQGHVDGVGTLVSVESVGETRIMDFRIPREVADLTILHGSITLNGISLTVSDLPGEDVCRIGVIPHTWHNTNLHALNPGDPVNVEGDLIGKYVGKLMSARSGPGSRKDLDLDRLEGMGY